jgi:membrane protease YdiL (CAAX protease family)
MNEADPDSVEPQIETKRPTVLGALFMGTVGNLLLSVLTTVLVLALVMLARALGHPVEKSGPAITLLESALGCLTIFFALSLIRGFSFPAMSARYGLRWPAISLGTFAIAAVGTLALTIGMNSSSVMLRRLHWLPELPASPFPRPDLAHLPHAGIPMLVALALAKGIFPGLGEELLSRGHVQRGLLAHWSPFASIVVTSVLFALWHVAPVRYLGTFAFSCWVGWIAWRCDSIVPGMALHVINNWVFAFAVVLTRALPARVLGPHRQLPASTLVASAWAGLVLATVCASLLVLQLPAAPAREGRG